MRIVDWLPYPPLHIDIGFGLSKTRKFLLCGKVVKMPHVRYIPVNRISRLFHDVTDLDLDYYDQSFPNILLYTMSQCIGNQ